MNPIIQALLKGSLGQDQERTGLNIDAVNKVGGQRFSDAYERVGQSGNPKYGLNLPSTVLPDMGWDAFFGSLQQKEEEAQKAGKNFKMNWSGFGRLKDQDVPSGKIYDRESGEVAPGLRGRPNAATAALEGLDPNKSGYYTEDEYNAMSGNRWSPLTMMQGLFRR